MEFFNIQDMNIQNKINSGAFGTVYSIKDKMNHQFFAIKEIPDIADIADGEKQKKRNF